MDSVIKIVRQNCSFYDDPENPDLTLGGSSPLPAAASDIHSCKKLLRRGSTNN